MGLHVFSWPGCIVLSEYFLCGVTETTMKSQSKFTHGYIDNFVLIVLKHMCSCFELQRLDGLPSLSSICLLFEY